MLLNIDPKVDYAFKHLFGRDATRPLLIDLLNGVLEAAPGRHIQDVVLLNPFNPKETLDDKLSILDVKARDQAGRQINIEMQMFVKAYFTKRIVYYMTKLHQQQLHEGQTYSALQPTISIVFQNEVQFPEIEDYHLSFQLLEKKHRMIYSKDLEIHVLELPKFKKTEAEVSSGLDAWLYLLRHAEALDTESSQGIQANPLIAQAVRELMILSQSDLERERYEAREKGPTGSRYGPTGRSRRR